MTFNVKTEIALTDKRVADVLCSGFEGGINYWAGLGKVTKPEGAVPHTTEKGWLMVDGEGYPSYIAAPLLGGSVEVISDPEDDPQKHVLNRAAIEAGLLVLANDYPHHFLNIINENDDAETGDVLIQCAIFGEIVYG